MADAQGGMVGVFAHADGFIEAIEKLRQAGFRDLQALSPVPVQAVDEALAKPQSPVRLFTLAGCLAGAAIAFLLTILASLHYPIVTGGKPILSFPPFFIIVFELTILFGGLLTLGGMLLNARLPRVSIVPAYDPRFSEDRFGLWVPCDPRESETVSRLLRESGAEEVVRKGLSDQGNGYV